MKHPVTIMILLVTLVISYGAIGTGTKVDQIKATVTPEIMAERGWEILRYEGYQWGSFDKHGGYCWYHVQNIDNHNIQYRVRVAIWGDELQFYYGSPEDLSRLDIKL